jgi:SAM-dependent methyltransferase
MSASPSSGAPGAGDPDPTPDLDPTPNVYGRELSAEEIAAGKHRELVGGLWDEVGPRQLEFLVARGLRPGMRMLDLGCGCLRGGIHLVRFLDRGNYYGIDVNASLLAAGRRELEEAGLGDRLPSGNLLRNDGLEGGRFGVDFDVVLAHSLFTHLPAAWLRRYLSEAVGHVPAGGRVFVTYFEWPEGWPAGEPLRHEPGGIVTFADRDPFHYRVEDLRRCAAGLPWELQVIGEWGHPRDQRMASYTRS